MTQRNTAWENIFPIAVDSYKLLQILLRGLSAIRNNFLRLLSYVAASCLVVGGTMLIAGYLTQYVIVSWASFLQGQSVSIRLFPCLLGGIFLSRALLPFSCFTFLFFALL